MKSWKLGLASAFVLTLALSTSQAGAGAQAKCNNSNPVEIGTMYSMTGPLAGIGRLAQLGATLAIQDINAAGGVLGRCVKQNLKDEGGDPTKAAQVVRELVDKDGVKFIVGPFGSSPTSTSIPYMTQAKVINVNQSSFALSGDAEKFPYTFRTESHTTQQIDAYIPYFKANGWTRVGVLAVNTAFGTAFASGMQTLAPPAGMTITKSILVNSGTADITPQMNELKDSNPHVLLAAISADPDQIAMLKSRYQLGWNIPVVGTNALSNPGTVNNFTPDQMKNVFMGPSYKTLMYESTAAGKGAPKWPQTRVFIKGFAKLLKANNLKITISQSTGSYDSFRLLANAINKAKSLDPDRIKTYLETNPYVGVRGRYTWNTVRHDGANPSMFAFAYAKSLNNYGILRMAPNQK